MSFGQQLIRHVWLALCSGAMVTAILSTHSLGENSFICVADDAMADVRPASPSCSAPPPPPQADLSGICVPTPLVPDPRMFNAGAPTLKLDIRSSLRIAVGNSEVVRVIPGATSTIAGSPT